MTGWPKAWPSGSPGAACQSCGRGAGRRLVFGIPGPDMHDALTVGESDIALGGCIRYPDVPIHRCPAGGAELTITPQEFR